MVKPIRIKKIWQAMRSSGVNMSNNSSRNVVKVARQNWLRYKVAAV